MRHVAYVQTLGSFTINLSTWIDHEAHDSGMGICNRDIINLLDGIKIT